MTSAIRKRRRNIGSANLTRISLEEILNHDQILPLDILHYIFCQTRELIRKGMLISRLLNDKLRNDYIKHICSEPISQKEYLKYISVKNRRVKILSEVYTDDFSDSYSFLRIDPKSWKTRQYYINDWIGCTKTRKANTNDTYSVFFHKFKGTKLMEDICTFQKTKNPESFKPEHLNLKYLDLNTMFNILNRR